MNHNNDSKSYNNINSNGKDRFNNNNNKFMKLSSMNSTISNSDAIIRNITNKILSNKNTHNYGYGRSSH